MTDPARTGRLDVLVEGYVRLPHVAGTATLVRDAARVIVIDPEQHDRPHVIAGVNVIAADADRSAQEQRRAVNRARAVLLLGREGPHGPGHDHQLGHRRSSPNPTPRRRAAAA